VGRWAGWPPDAWPRGLPRFRIHTDQLASRRGGLARAYNGGLSAPFDERAQRRIKPCHMLLCKSYVLVRQQPPPPPPPPRLEYEWGVSTMSTGSRYPSLYRYIPAVFKDKDDARAAGPTPWVSTAARMSDRLGGCRGWHRANVC
jgi:hypothetical protein